MVEINIDSEVLKKLKKIGEGSEGIVYNAGHGLLYKVYKTKFYVTIDSDHMKKRYSPRIIIDAANRQEEIKHSILPLGPLYIDGKFAGCVLKYHKGYINIHNIGILSRKAKIAIMKKLISYVKELTDHNIYHIDLSNKRVSDGNHSNILIALNGNIQIIDLDGKSTIYTKTFDEEFYNLSLQSLLFLIVDILFNVDFLEEDLQEEDLNYFENYLINLGIYKECANMIVTQNNISYEKLNELVDISSKIKKLTIR